MILTNALLDDQSRVLRRRTHRAVRAYATASDIVQADVGRWAAMQGHGTILSFALECRPGRAGGPRPTFFRPGRGGEPSRSAGSAGLRRQRARDLRETTVVPRDSRRQNFAILRAVKRRRSFFLPKPALEKSIFPSCACRRSVFVLTPTKAAASDRLRYIF